MNLLPPLMQGPLSECNGSATVTNAVPGADVTLFANRGGIEIRIGSGVVTGTKGAIPLDAGAQFIAGDTVNASQELNGDVSPRSTSGPQVQTSVAIFDAAQVLSHLYRCSRGFFVGGVRPGTHVQVLQGGAVIGSGDAIDGIAAIGVPGGLPAAGTQLTARQLICPKPPPPPPSTGYLHDSALPPVIALPYQAGQSLPAPLVIAGLTACSRAVQIASIQPGADVILEAASGAWWASLGPSDQTSNWMALPVKLREGEEVAIRQEVGPRCELQFDRVMLTVGPAQRLGKPRLAQIDCNTTPSIFVVDVKPEADVEFAVTVSGVESTYRTTATESLGPVPAPPMPAGATVKVRQGECDVWSDWSDPQTANPLTTPPLQPKISRELFACQDAIPVENVFPLNGDLRVMSKKHGELLRTPAGGNAPVLTVAPSLTREDLIWVEHLVCGYATQSEARAVQPSREVQPGSIDDPVYDGDTTVLMTQGVAGARVELWEETRNKLLQSARAPFADTWNVDVNFGGFGTLRYGMRIHVKTLHCGHFVQTPSVRVVHRPPELTSISPSIATIGEPGFILTAKGKHFLNGARVQWNNTDRPTTFVSDSELQITVNPADLTAVTMFPLRVVNPDGQPSGIIHFSVVPVPEPVEGYDELLIQNCNGNMYPGTFTHRPIHIYFRRTDLGYQDSWAEIADSPHEPDYDESGQCPADAESGARFALEDGVTYEIAVTDPLLTACVTGGPDEPACLMAFFPIRGKAGGGVFPYTVTVP